MSNQRYSPEFKGEATSYIEAYVLTPYNRATNRRPATSVKKLGLRDVQP